MTRKTKRQRAARKQSLPRCVLDSGAISALLGRSQRARAWLRWLATHAGEVVVPVVTLAECTTGNGGRDAEVNRVLRALSTAPISEDTARLAGSLRFEAGSDDGIDALVAAEALKGDQTSVVLTSDPQDLRQLLARHPRVHVVRV